MVEPWEGVLTFLFFPLLVALSCPGDGAGVEYSMVRIFLK
jgi:hypothetical protein